MTDGLVYILVMLWIACLGLVLVQLLQLDVPAAQAVLRFLEAILPGGDR